MKTYYLTPKFKLVNIIISILILVFLFKIIPNYYCIGVFAVVILLIAVSNIRSERIILSDKVIQYRRLGLAFNAKWEDIEGVGKNFLIPVIYEGLLIDPERIRMSEWWLGSYANWIRKAFIPLSCFANNWRDSDLGQQIKQHAPHLFEKEKSA
jgi:hypothetical protein